MALRAGAAIVHARNTALSEFFEPNRHYLEFSPTDDEIDRVCDVVASERDLDGMRDVFLADFTRTLGPDAMVRRLLKLADTGGD